VVVTRPECAGAGGAGGRASAGAGGAGASGGVGGASGQSGHSGGTVARPSYNTGTGFFVVGNKLYDANGNELRIRGLNKLHWDSDSPGIPKTHANTVRWDIDFSQSTATNLRLMQQSIASQIVPMPGNWQGTCDEKADTLTKIVDTWVAQASAWKTLERSMILNIANEWGPSGSGWRDAYIAAIGRLRAAGYSCTISVDSGGCGQSNEDLANYARAVFDSDPQKNVIFDQHIYGNWNATGQSGLTKLSTGLDTLAATGLPMIVGEFGPGRSIGPSPTDLTPAEIMQACEARGIGWLAWAWDDPASNADDTWFALSKNGKYDSSADLTMFGNVVVEDPSYGLLALAQPATIF
jgi:mannan endo-1,4-beta-mannosidase